MILPLAHVGHYLWVFYLLPVIVVVIGILKTTLSEKKAQGEEFSQKEGSDQGEESSREDDEPSVLDAPAPSPGPEPPPPAGGTGGEAENENLARRPPRP